jgi:sigma-B regulation protein RsbU (phosphoserine phosphatase)
VDEVLGEITTALVLDSVGAGVYVTDTNRRIIYWGKAAEKITGWPARDIVGRCCFDNILSHVDKDGHSLCGQEYCPLHRCIVTGQASVSPVIMFARTPAGARVPLEASVAPLRAPTGEIIGGVETFRDLSHEFADIDRARTIQQLMLQQELPAEPRISFAARYVPLDMIGGDFYAVVALDAQRYGVLIADVAGHGVPAALYTMYLNSLWTTHRHELLHPARFAQTVSEHLHALARADNPFAAATCALIDLERGELRLAGAGNPPPFIVRVNGQWDCPRAFGLPLGLLESVTYKEVVVPLRPGDCMLFFTDGAIEFTDTPGVPVGADGLQRILRGLGYPGQNADFPAIETAMLAASDQIRFGDDVTFLEARLS